MIKALLWGVAMFKRGRVWPKKTNRINKIGWKRNSRTILIQCRFSHQASRREMRHCQARRIKRIIRWIMVTFQ